MSMRAIQPSTRIEAREWMIQNLPPGTRIAQEWYRPVLTLCQWESVPTLVGTSRWVVSPSPS